MSGLRRVEHAYGGAVGPGAGASVITGFSVLSFIPGVPEEGSPESWREEDPPEESFPEPLPPGVLLPEESPCGRLEELPEGVSPVFPEEFA